MWERDSDREENTDTRFLRDGTHEKPSKSARKLTGLVKKWEESLKAFTSQYYTVEKPMEATKVLEQCIAELKAAIS